MPNRWRTGLAILILVVLFVAPLLAGLPDIFLLTLNGLVWGVEIRDHCIPNPTFGRLLDRSLPKRVQPN
jgi:hypothetical protein